MFELRKVVFNLLANFDQKFGYQLNIFGLLLFVELLFFLNEQSFKHGYSLVDVVLDKDRHKLVELH